MHAHKRKETKREKKGREKRSSKKYGAAVALQIGGPSDQIAQRKSTR